MYLEPGKIPPVADWVVDYMNSNFKKHIAKRPTRRSVLRQRTSYETFFDKKYWQNFMNSRENEPLMSYLEKHTYPFKKPVESMWMNYYSADMKNENGFGGFLGLHQDYHNWKDRSGDHMVFVNSVLIDQSDDMVGGEIVLAGDSIETRQATIRREIDTRDIMHRLKVIRQKPGDVIFWNGLTLHGVSQIEKGDRLTMMVVKVVDGRDDRHFDRRKFSDPYNE